MQTLDSAPVGGIGLAETPTRTTVRLWGEIDEALRDQVGGVVVRAAERNVPVVLDTEAVTFIDSTGIAFLIQFSRLSGEDGISVTLQDPPPVVTNILDMLGLRQLFSAGTAGPGDGSADDSSPRPADAPEAAGEDATRVG